MFLETERLTLRPFTEKDLDDFFLLMANPESMRFSLSGPLSKEAAKETLEKRVLGHQKKYGYGLMALFLKENQSFMGYAGLINQTIDGVQEVELGYRLLPEFWDRGYATEAAIRLCAYGFLELKLDHLISIIEAANNRSINVALKVGMSRWKSSLFNNIPVDIYRLEHSCPQTT